MKLIFENGRKIFVLNDESTVLQEPNTIHGDHAESYLKHLKKRQRDAHTFARKNTLTDEQAFALRTLEWLIAQLKKRLKT